MRVVKFFVLGCLVLAGSARADEESASPLIGDVVNGGKLYRANCAVCHGYDGSGQGPAAKVLGKARPADHRDGSVMNSLDDRMLFGRIREGCRAANCAATMPAFADLDTLEIWDLVAFLRSLHLPLQAFFPQVDQYLVKRYTVGQIGPDEFRAGQLERVQKFAGKVDAKDLEQTTFTTFRADPRRASPELVPQEPRRLAELTKDNKLGYVFFMDFIDPRGARIPVGLAIDPNFTITHLVAAGGDPGRVNELNTRFQKFIGLGKRGDKPDFATADKKDKVQAAFDVAVRRLYTIAVEAANAYEFEEKDRSWADGTF
jgi:mono/diheme cytochrome c family protein